MRPGIPTASTATQLFDDDICHDTKTLTGWVVTRSCHPFQLIDRNSDSEGAKGKNRERCATESRIRIIKKRQICTGARETRDDLREAYRAPGLRLGQLGGGGCTCCGQGQYACWCWW